MAARLALNIKVLKRHDSSIDVILDHASFVVLYKHEDGKWSKTGAEGPMFLYHRTQAPHYGLFLLNRNGVENFSASFSSSDNLELTPDLIMYQMEPEMGPDGEDEGETFGLWIFEGEQKDRIGKLMLELHELSIEDEPSPSTSFIGQPAQSNSQQQQSHSHSQQHFQDQSNPFPPQSQPQFVTHPQQISGISLLNSIFQSASSTTPTLSNASLASPSPSHQPQSAPTASNLLSSLPGNPNQNTNFSQGSDASGLKALLGLGPSSYSQQPPQFSPNLQHQPPPRFYQQQQQQQQSYQFQNPVPQNFNHNQQQQQQQQQQQHVNGLEALFASARMNSPSPSPVPPPAQLQQLQPRPQTSTAPASFSNHVNRPNANNSNSQLKSQPPTEPKALRNGKVNGSTKSVGSSSKESFSPKMAAEIVNGALAERKKGQEPVIEKREFVREILSLVHTDPNFVDDLFSRYLERTK